MPYTTPRTWVAGEYPTAAQLNANVRDNISFLANPPTCRVFNSVAISLPDNATTVVTFNSERWDTDNMHSTSSNTSRITFNTAGLYLVAFQGQMAAAADYANLLPILRVNGATDIAYGTRIDAVAGQAPLLHVQTVYKFVVGNYIEALVYQDNTANAARNLDANPPVSPEFTATWVGLG